MDPTLLIGLAIKYKVELIAAGLLSFQGWMGKTEKIKACNYLDLAINILTAIKNGLVKTPQANKEEETK